MRDLANRLLAHPELPSHYRVIGPVLLFLQQDQTALATFHLSADGDDVWLSGLAHMFLVDLRWIDLHLRRDDTDQALTLISSARERALHASSTELLILIDVREADLRVRLGDLSRAADLLDAAERGLRGDTAFPADHARTLVGNARSALRLAPGDLPGADKALREAHTAALATGELPILSLTTVHAAALAEAHERHHETAVLLDTASRLRGTHDRTDPRVRELTHRAQTALGEEEFAAAYAQGWEPDAETTATDRVPGVLGTAGGG